MNKNQNNRKYFEGEVLVSYEGIYVIPIGLRVANPERMEEKYLKQIDEEIIGLLKEGYFTDSYEFWKDNLDKELLEENFERRSD